ncbi:hypothetical protein TcarDRAFT_2726 [Thermosinus carboxydivorans Nor1]|uniref:Uncharacterized protein n=1 Tax=Thermosinus carboxydivorans Nor1 TaxID=401526 RepID=A1HLV9_9FIRM|nr:hypothetical protein TcarDRAFT_2726 [Thermosinus carboxydivorans Nor1]
MWRTISKIVGVSTIVFSPAKHGHNIQKLSSLASTKFPAERLLAQPKITASAASAAGEATAGKSCISWKKQNNAYLLSISPLLFDRHPRR